MSELLKDLKIIRKLGELESIFDNELINNNLSQTRTFIVSIPNKYKIELSVLKQALKLLIDIHPLLKATTYRELDKETQKSKLFLDKYFVYMNDPHAENVYNNIEYIDTWDTFDWETLVERELKTTLDFINGPLWRIKVVKDNTIHKSSSDASTQYALVLTTSHSISDGRSGYSLGLQYLNILIDVLEKNETKYEVETLCEFSLDDLVRQLRSQPDFQSRTEDIHLDMETNTTPSNVGNKVDGVYGRFEHLDLYKETFGLIVKKMKMNAPKAKLTSLISVLLAKSYKNTCIKHEANTSSLLDGIQFSLAKSPRETLKVDNNKMGCYVTSLYCRIDLNKSDQDFWTLVENDSILLHKRIANNEEFSLWYENKNVKDIFTNLINSNYDFVNHSSLSYAISNIGPMKNTKNERVIRVLSHYVSIPCNEQRFGPYIYFGLTSIDNNFFLAISYSEKVYSTQFVRDLKVEFLEQIKTILE